MHDLLARDFGFMWRLMQSVRRGAIDHDVALRRMDSSGATLTTTEAALFEWCGRAGSPEFKQISQLVKETAAGVIWE